MASGRLPGDFWPRHPGPGAETPSEPDIDAIGAYLEEDSLAENSDEILQLLTEPSDIEEAMKRPSARRAMTKEACQSPSWNFESAQGQSQS